MGVPDNLLFMLQDLWWLLNTSAFSFDLGFSTNQWLACHNLPWCQAKPLFAWQVHWTLLCIFSIIFNFCQLSWLLECCYGDILISKQPQFTCQIWNAYLFFKKNAMGRITEVLPAFFSFQKHISPCLWAISKIKKLASLLCVYCVCFCVDTLSKLEKNSPF